METITIRQVERDYALTLKAFRIEPRPATVSILKIITERFPKGFTLYELLETAEKENMKISTATIVTTIGMFRIRKLVVEARTAEEPNITGKNPARYTCVLNLYTN